MAGYRTLWQYSHTVSILFAILLFTAGFLCTLLWTNDIVHTPTSTGGPLASTFTAQSPAVSTFSITYNVAIFGIVWNSILFVTQLILEHDTVPLSTTRLRYEVEKSACIVTVVGNAVYSVACIALMATLARLASDATSVPSNPGEAISEMIAASANDRRAGQGVTAAMAGLAGASAWCACVMDILHQQSSRHRSIVKGTVRNGDEATVKQA